MAERGPRSSFLQIGDIIVKLVGGKQPACSPLDSRRFLKLDC